MRSVRCRCSGWCSEVCDRHVPALIDEGPRVVLVGDNPTTSIIHPDINVLGEGTLLRTDRAGFALNRERHGQVG